MGNIAGSYITQPSKIKGVIKRGKSNYLRVLELLIEKPYTRQELLTITKLKEKTLDGILSRLTTVGIIKRIGKGEYAFKSYQPEEVELEKTIINTTKYLFGLDEENPFLIPSSDSLSMATDEKFIREVAARFGKDPNNPQFRELLFKVLKKIEEKGNILKKLLKENPDNVNKVKEIVLNYKSFISYKIKATV
jgi:predicted transcriptional regulator